MYRILCDRSSRELGAGLTWLKKMGQVAEFVTMADAEAEAKELNEGPNATKIKYTAKRHDEEGDSAE